MAVNAHSIIGANGKRSLMDFYPTPPSVTEALFKRETFIGEVWECASGDGSMAKIIEKYNSCYSSDIRSENIYGDPCIDFLLTNRQADNVVTNPPFNLAVDFLHRAMVITKYKIAFFLKLSFLEGQERYHIFQNTPLKTVYVFSARQNLYAMGDKKTGGCLIAFAWFVWDKSYNGKPQIEWIKR